MKDLITIILAVCSLNVILAAILSTYSEQKTINNGAGAVITRWYDVWLCRSVCMFNLVLSGSIIYLAVDLVF